MNCQEFEQLWQQCLDMPADAGLAWSSALESHASGCVDCQPLQARFLTLAKAVRALPAPLPPAGFADRCLEVYASAPASVPFRPRFHPLAYVAAAAAVLIASVVALRGWQGGVVAPQTAVREIAGKTDDARPITEALADATAATWQLARDTSAPAARIGRQVIASASLPQADWPVALPAGEASGVLQSVSDRVEAGVRPLPVTARKAFGFLLPSLGGAPPAAKSQGTGA